MPKKSAFEKFLERSALDFEKRAVQFIQETVKEVTPAWIQPLVDEVLPAQQDPKSNQTEAKVRDRLAQKLNGWTEVHTPAGRIDILTRTEIIEVKCAKNWKHALGQIMAYSPHYPRHKKRIHLYGVLPATKLKEIKAHCQLQSVRVTWEA